MTAAQASHPAPRPVIGVTMGDPLGIGPEIIVRSLAEIRDRADGGRASFRIYGNAGVMEQAAALVGVVPFWHARCENAEPDDGDTIVLIDDGRTLPPDAIERPGSTPIGGETSHQAFVSAIDDACLPAGDARRIDAIVTAPISKTSWDLASLAGAGGHTELLASRFPAAPHAMMFIGPKLRVALASVHVPLRQVSDVLTAWRIEEVIVLTHETCERLGVPRPRIAVCGVNPHAGEGGLLGDEDASVVEPAVEAARGRGIDAHGPLPADGAFPGALSGSFDAVVAMYHDQGLVPVKAIERDLTVNTTVGLPIVRTSPAHGTAFDIAWTAAARHDSMTAAINLAVRLASRSGS